MDQANTASKNARNSVGSTALVTELNAETIFTSYTQRLANNLVYNSGEQAAASSVVLFTELAQLSSSWNSELELQPVWSRDNFRQLIAELDRRAIRVLHLNLNYDTFDYAVLENLLQEVEQRKVSLCIHFCTIPTRISILELLISYGSKLITANQQIKLSLIAAGAPAEKAFTLQTATNAVQETRASLSAALGFAKDDFIIAVPFAGTAPTNATCNELLTSFSLLYRLVPQARLCVLQRGLITNRAMTEAAEYVTAFARNADLSDRVSVIVTDSTEHSLSNWLAEANSMLIHRDELDITTEELLCYAYAYQLPTLLSVSGAAFPLQPVLCYSEQHPLCAALERLVKNPKFVELIKQEMQVYTPLALSTCKQALDATHVAQLESASNLQSTSSGKSYSSQSMRVLMQNRGNAFSQRGGDTVVMERVANLLKGKGLTVDFDLQGEANPADYDIVHIYNFATPEITERYARAAHAKNVPYVVTTMYEDNPRFVNQMWLQFKAFQAYVEAKQPQAQWPALERQIASCPPAEKWNNSWTAEHAASLIASGEQEQATLERDYPQAGQIDLYKCGCDILDTDVNGELFYTKTGIRDFVLCVGRLETRKNQLALLKALEDSDLTLVFVGGGFTYQPEYEALCHSFRRRGKTVFLGRLDSAVLASAYKAARVHALPSWYELPGIVSMEAARQNTNIVVTDYGTPRDYFGKSAFYCAPDDVQSIHDAVKTAFESAPRPGLTESVKDCTWSATANTFFEIYQRVLDNTGKHAPQRATDSNLISAASVTLSSSASKQLPVSTLRRAAEKNETSSRSISKLSRTVHESTSLSHEQAVQLCIEADNDARSGDHNTAGAKYQQAAELCPSIARPLRSLGVLCLQEGNAQQAEELFQQALKLEPTDGRSLAGLATCLWKSGDLDGAFTQFQHAFNCDPADLSLLFNFMNICHELTRFAELETAIHASLEHNPENLNVWYCLAGCFFRQGKFNDAESCLVRILAREPQHEDALELKNLIDTERQKLQPTQTNHSTEVDSNATSSVAVENQIALLERVKEAGDLAAVISNAEKLIDRAGISKSDQTLAWLYKAEALAKQGQGFSEAREIFEQVLSGEFHRARALIGLGALYGAEDQWDLAEEKFTAALNEKPDSDGARAGLAVCATTRGENQRAWELFLEALEINPENLRALYGVIQLGYKNEKLDVVEEKLREYLALHPANISMLYSYAGALYARGKKQEALEQLQRIMIFEPNHKHALELLEKIKTEQTASPSNGLSSGAHYSGSSH